MVSKKSEKGVVKRFGDAAACVYHRITGGKAQKPRTMAEQPQQPTYSQTKYLELKGQYDAAVAQVRELTQKNSDLEEEVVETEILGEDKQRKLGEIIHQQKTGAAQQRRVIRTLQARSVEPAYEACIKANEGRRSPVFVVNHLGRIVLQTKSAKRLFGDLYGKPYSALIGGTTEEVGDVSREVAKRDVKKEWIQSITKDGSTKPARVNVTHFYQRIVDQQTVDGKPKIVNVDYPYATVIEVVSLGFGRFSRRQPCLQESLKKYRTPEEKAKESDKIIEDSRKMIEEIRKKHPDVARDLDTQGTGGSTNPIPTTS